MQGRDQHTWVDLAGNKYAAIGTNKCLYIYFEGAFYDITPLDTTRQQTGATFTTVSGSPTVTLTTSSAHGAETGDIILGSSATSVPGGFSASDFDDILFEVYRCTQCYDHRSNDGKQCGLKCRTFRNTYSRFLLCDWSSYSNYGYGWGTNTWSGQTLPLIQTTLDGALLNDAYGTGGSGTDIDLVSTTGFTSSGTILVESELITYTGITSNTLNGIVRGTNGTSKLLIQMA